MQAGGEALRVACAPSRFVVARADVLSRNTVTQTRMSHLGPVIPEVDEQRHARLVAIALQHPMAQRAIKCKHIASFGENDSTTHWVIRLRPLQLLIKLLI